MLRVAILGGSGYTGGELLRLLGQHPHVEITAVTSERSAGNPVSALFPGLGSCASGPGSQKFEPLLLKNILKRADLFFLCLPHKTSQETVAGLYKAGKKAVDLSADFRIKDAGIYERWYKTKHKFRSLLKLAVYGLPELYRDKIRNAPIIANPGCYPVSVILGLAPVMRDPAIDTTSIIIDSKSGVSGAGRAPSLPFMFSEANESVKAYAVTTHRHTPEIEQELGLLAKRKTGVTFTPHLIPMDRGILSTMYVRIKRSLELSHVHKTYRDFYRNEPFVRVLEKGAFPSTKAVKGTNLCDISVFIDKRHPGREILIVVSAIDNLLKGASGQAVHNMNIMYGFGETTGLSGLPQYP